MHGQTTNNMLGIPQVPPTVINQATLSRPIKMTPELGAQFPSFLANTKQSTKVRQISNSVRDPAGILKATSKPTGTQVFMAVQSHIMPVPTPPVTAEDQAALASFVGDNTGPPAAFKEVFLNMSARMAPLDPMATETVPPGYPIIESGGSVWQAVGRSVADGCVHGDELRPRSVHRFLNVGVLRDVDALLKCGGVELASFFLFLCDVVGGPFHCLEAFGTNSLASPQRTIIYNRQPMTVLDPCAGVTQLCSEGCQLCAGCVQVMHTGMILNPDDPAIKKMQIQCTGSKCEGKGVCNLEEIEEKMLAGGIEFMEKPFTIKEMASPESMQRIRSRSTSGARSINPLAFSIQVSVDMEHEDITGVVQDICVESETIYLSLGRDIDNLDVTIEADLELGVKDVVLSFPNTAMAQQVRMAFDEILQGDIEAMVQVFGPLIDEKDEGIGSLATRDVQSQDNPTPGTSRALELGSQDADRVKPQDGDDLVREAKRQKLQEEQSKGKAAALDSGGPALTMSEIHPAHRLACLRNALHRSGLVHLGNDNCRLLLENNNDICARAVAGPQVPVPAEGTPDKAIHGEPSKKDGKLPMTAALSAHAQAMEFMKKCMDPEIEVAEKRDTKLSPSLSSSKEVYEAFKTLYDQLRALAEAMASVEARRGKFTLLLCAPGAAKFLPIHLVAQLLLDTKPVGLHIVNPKTNLDPRDPKWDWQIHMIKLHYDTEE